MLESALYFPHKVDPLEAFQCRRSHCLQFHCSVIGPLTFLGVWSPLPFQGKLYPFLPIQGQCPAPFQPPNLSQPPITSLVMLYDAPSQL